MPVSKFAMSIHSLGAWKLPLGGMNPMTVTGRPRIDAKLAATGTEPPSRTNSGARPNVASRARAYARVAGWSCGVSVGRPPPVETTSTRTPGGAICIT